MNKFQEISEQIKNLKTARDFLKEKFPQSTVPSTPKDEEIYKLLTAIQQLDKYIKELQDAQFKALKQEE